MLIRRLGPKRCVVRGRRGHDRRGGVVEEAAAAAETYTDTLTRDVTGITNSNYDNWTYTAPESGVSYAGHSAGSNSSIQLRSTMTSSTYYAGIINTTSIGNIVSVKLTWNSNTSTTSPARAVYVYGSDTPFDSPNDLFADGVDYLESLTYADAINNDYVSEYEFQADYPYIGIRSYSGAIYLTSVEFEWEDGAATGISSLSIGGTLAKTEYLPGEDWDTTGLSVTANYEGGGTAEIDNDNVEWSFSPEKAVAGTTQVAITASYGGVEVTQSYSVTVSEATLSTVTLVGDLATTEYYSDAEAWDGSGFTVDLAYSDNSTRTGVNTGFTLSYSPEVPTPGTTSVSVTATYDGVTSATRAFDVTVHPYRLSYSYTPTSALTTGTSELNGLDWTLYLSTASAFLGTDSDKGAQIGSQSNNTTTATLFSEAFIGNGDTLISRIVVNASSASQNSGYTTITVLVNGTEIGTEDITDTATDYVFDLETPAYGSVEIVYDQSASSSKRAMYFGGVEIYAETDDTGTDIIPAVQALEAIKTCDVIAGDEEFGAIVTNYASIIEANRETLEGIYIRDYADGDTTYAGNRENRVSFMDKYNACYEKYAASADVSSLIDSSNGEGILIAACVLLAAATVGGAYVLIRKRRTA